MRTLRVDVLGPPRFLLDGTEFRIARRKTAALVLRLALEGPEGIPRSVASGLFWPEFAPDKARASLRNAILDANACAGLRLLTPIGELIRFDEGIEVRTDAGLLLEASSRSPALEEKATRTALEEAARLYRGDFLSGFFLKDAWDFEDWQLVQTELFRARAIDVLGRLAGLDLAAGGREAAEATARRMISLAPRHEAGYRLVVRILAERGETAAALEQYRAYANLLERELGGKPEAAFARYCEGLEKGGTELRAPEERPRGARLPHWNASFVGRSKESGLLRTLLETRSCVALTGPAGVGKTRLAVEVAHSVSVGSGCRALYVDLSRSRAGSGETLALLASALGVRLAPGSDATSLASGIEAGRLLLILDGFEGVRSECAAAAAAILARDGASTILAVGLVPLGLDGETRLVLGPLALPPEDLRPGAPEALAFDAPRLLLERASLVESGPSLDRFPEALTAICRHLEGFPLAIELTASRIHETSLAVLAADPESLYRLIETSKPGAASRHAGLGSLLDWSWSLLEKGEAGILEALSVFVGGFDLDAAVAVLGREPRPALRDLTEKSFLLGSPAEGGTFRWRVPASIRRRVAMRLEASPRSRDLRDAHLAHFLSKARAFEKGLTAIGSDRVLEDIGREWGNLRSAFAHALALGRCADALELLYSLRRFFRIRAYRAELSGLLRDIDRSLLGTPRSEAQFLELCAVSVERASEPSGYADILGSAARAWTQAGDDTAARVCEFRRLAALAQAEPEPEALADRIEEEALILEGRGAWVDACEAWASLAALETPAVRRERGDPLEALRRAEAAASRSGDLEALALCAWRTATLAKRNRDRRASEDALARVLDCALPLGNLALAADALLLQAEAALGALDYAKALELSRQGSALEDRMRRTGHGAWFRLFEAEALHGLGEREAAFACLDAAQALASAARSEPGVSVHLAGYRALFLALEGDGAAAIAALSEARARHFEDEQIRASLDFLQGRILLGLGEEEDAERYLSRTPPGSRGPAEAGPEDQREAALLFIRAKRAPLDVLERLAASMRADGADEPVPRLLAGAAARAFEALGMDESAWKAALRSLDAAGRGRCFTTLYYDRPLLRSADLIRARVDETSRVGIEARLARPATPAGEGTDGLSLREELRTLSREALAGRRIDPPPPAGSLDSEGPRPDAAHHSGV